MKALMSLVVCLLLTCTQALAQDWAKETLNKSPRHLDWVTVKQGNRDIKCFIAYPEVSKKATTVLVVHEIFGLSDWVRKVCDELAAAGFIAIAPDLLSAPGGKTTASYKDEDSVRSGVTSLPPDQVTADLNAVAAYAAKLPAANGKIAVAGFCWGGAQTFRYATNNPNVKGAFVFYGAPPKDDAALNRIKAPVYGFYAQNDARVTSTVEGTIASMKKAGRTYEPVTYDGAGHGFMRAGQAPNANAADKKARTEAWTRFVQLLGK